MFSDVSYATDPQQLGERGTWLGAGPGGTLIGGVTHIPPVALPVVPGVDNVELTTGVHLGSYPRIDG